MADEECIKKKPEGDISNLQSAECFLIFQQILVLYIDVLQIFDVSDVEESVKSDRKSKQNGLCTTIHTHTHTHTHTHATLVHSYLLNVYTSNGTTVPDTIFNGLVPM